MTAASVSLEDARYRDPAAVNHLFDATLERIRRSPGVESAAVSLGLPYTRLLNIGGLRFDDESNGHIVNCSYVTPDFARTLRIPVERGRDLREADRADAAPVVLVNESFARLYSKDRDVIGRRILLSGVPREIVGVVGDVQQAGSGFFVDGMAQGPIRTTPTVYLPAAQASTLFSTHVWSGRTGSCAPIPPPMPRARFARRLAASTACCRSPTCSRWPTSKSTPSASSGC